MQKLCLLVFAVAATVLVGNPTNLSAQYIDSPDDGWINENFSVTGFVGRYNRPKVEIQLFVYSTGIAPGGGNGLRPLPFRVPARVNLMTKRFRADFGVWDPCLGMIGGVCYPGWEYATLFGGNGCDDIMGRFWAGPMRADLYINDLKVDEHRFTFTHDDSGCQGVPPSLPGVPVE